MSYYTNQIVLHVGDIIGGLNQGLSMNLNLPMVIRPHVRVWLTRLFTVKQIGIAVNFSTLDRFKV